MQCCKTVTLRFRDRRNGNKSLFLEYYPGYRDPETMELRRRHSLGMYIYAKPENAFQKDFNKQILEKAEQIRCNVYLEVLNERYGFFSNDKMKESFLPYFKEQLSKSNTKTLASYKHFEKFCDGKCTFADLDLPMCRKFMEYLLSAKDMKHPELSLSQNSASAYWNVFRNVLGVAFKEKRIKDNLSDENLSIMDIPPYDTRMDFGISQQLKVQNILIPIDGLDAAVFRAIIRKVSEYLCINDLAMVHIFTRNAQWGHEDNIRKELAGILKEYGYDTGWVSKADNIDENEKRIKQRFFIDVCVDERTISKCINEQRVILDLRGVVDVFLYITAISKGVPRISFSEDQFLHDGQNGIIIDDHDQIGTSLAFYLDSLENWNAALVACYEAGKNYKTEVLLGKWRKVLGIVE